MVRRAFSGVSVGARFPADRRVFGNLFGWVIASSALGALGALSACDAGSDVTTSLVSPPGSAALAVVEPPVATDPAAVTASDVRRVRDLRGAATPTLRDRTTRAPTSAQTDAIDPTVTLTPLDGSALDNTTCARPAGLPDGGAIDVPTDGARSKGCEQSFSQRFFEVTVAPGEVVTVASPSPEAAAGRMWFSTVASCPADGACLAGWEWLVGEAAVANRGRFPIRELIAVTISDWSAATSYTLEVTREKLAPNASCATALPLGAGVTDQDLAGASVEPSGHGLRRGLYYSVELPPMTRAKVRASGNPAAMAYLRRDCDDDIIAATDEISNTTQAPLTAVVVAGPMWSNDLTPIDLALELTRLAPEAACDQPLAMVAGDSATFVVESGAAGPASCWCFQPTRALNVAVTVPAGQSVVVAGLSSADSGATLIELPEACAASCGDNSAFGWGETPAELRFTNDSALDQVRHFIVTSNAVWNAEGTSSSFPPVTLTVAAVE